MKKKLDQKQQAWVDARKRHRLKHVPRSRWPATLGFPLVGRVHRRTLRAVAAGRLFRMSR